MIYRQGCGYKIFSWYVATIKNLRTNIFWGGLEWKYPKLALIPSHSLVTLTSASVTGNLMLVIAFVFSSSVVIPES